jgi:uncharacterized membrane protein YhaH (DUF805 family)
MGDDGTAFGRGKWWLGQFIQLVIVGLLFAVWMEDLGGGVISSDMGSANSPPPFINHASKLVFTLVLIALAWIVHFYTAFRRYQDMGKFGAWVLTSFIPYIGPLFSTIHLGMTGSARKRGSRSSFADRAEEPADLPRSGYRDFDIKAEAIKQRSQLPELSNTSPVVTSTPRQTNANPVQRNSGFGRRGLF